MKVGSLVKFYRMGEFYIITKMYRLGEGYTNKGAPRIDVSTMKGDRLGPIRPSAVKVYSE